MWSPCLTAVTLIHYLNNVKVRIMLKVTVLRCTRKS